MVQKILFSKIHDGIEVEVGSNNSKGVPILELLIKDEETCLRLAELFIWVGETIREDQDVSIIVPL